MTRRVKVKGDPDGRSTRWSTHRESRRSELVVAAVAAIDQHGPTAGLDEIAAVAGVSKPVLYRYFADKADIHTAVGQWGAAFVMDRLLPALLTDRPVRDRVELAVEAYLCAIEEHPNVFLLLVRHRVSGDTDPLADGKAAIATTIARVMGDVLRDLGVDAGGAEPWAHGLVGLGLGTGEWWLDRRTMSRAHVGAYLTDFVWHALAGILAGHGVALDGGPSLRLVAGHEGDGYDGPAQVAGEPAGETPGAEVEVRLRGGFQPIDGRYHWHGRLAPSADLEAVAASGSSVLLRTPYGEARGRLSDLDPWGRYRVTGTGTPPFPTGPGGDPDLAAPGGTT